MKTVNLLPTWYRQYWRRQKNFRLHLVVMVVMGGAMFGATLLLRGHLAALERNRSALIQKLSLTPNSEAELRRQKVQLKRLDDLLLARRELGNTIPMSKVLQQMQNDLTPGMALSKVNIDVRPEAVKGSGFIGDTRNPPRYRDVAHLSVEGIAPNDVQIFQMIDRLSKNPLFAEVTLDYTRTDARQGFLARTFQIQLVMDLDKLISEAPNAAATPPANATDPIAYGGPVHGQ